MAKICRACHGERRVCVYTVSENDFAQWSADEIPDEIHFQTEVVDCPDCHGLGMQELRSDDTCTVTSLALQAQSMPF